MNDYCSVYDDVLKSRVQTEFETLYGHLEDAIVAFDFGVALRPIVACNHEYARLHGYKRHELIGQSLQILNFSFETLDVEEDAALGQRALEDLEREEYVEARAKHMRKDGSTLWVEYRNRLETLSGREVVLSLEKDVSDAVEEIQRSYNTQNTFQNFFAFVQDGVVIVDPQSDMLRIANCNPAFAIMNGYRVNELVGTPLQDFSLEQNKERYETWREKYRADFFGFLKQLGSITSQGVYKRKDDTLYPVSYTTSFVRFDEQEYVLYFVRDETEKRRAANLEHGRDKILDAVAHDTPLPQVLELVATMAQKQLSENRCLILMRHHEQWRVVAAPSLSDDEKEIVNSFYQEGLPLLFEDALRHDQPIFLEDVNATSQLHASLPVPNSFRVLEAISDTQYQQKGIVPGLETPVRACWLLPISSASKENLGAMLLFSGKSGKPEHISDVDALRRAASLAAIAIERQKHSELLLHQAEHDHLTDLPNRLLFEDRLRQMIARAQRYDHLVAVLFIDLDGFKHINDTLGHHAGDEVLQEVARRLRTCVRGSDTVARLGGDEFTLLLSDLKQPQNATQVARKVLQALQNPFDVLQHEVFVTASIGIALYPRDGEDEETLLRHADAAMYRAKSNGKNCYAFFEEAIGEALRDNLNLKAQLRRAFEKKQFEVFYQPVVSLADGHLENFEALLRWHHPRLGTMLPLSFIPAAEESGIILKIGEWVIEEVCRQIVQWQNDGWENARVAINVSALQFARTRLVEVLKRLLCEYSLQPSCLELELAEGALMRDMEDSKRQLERLRHFGVGLTIDDFGTGYSSLGYLQTLPMHRIKIDRSFINELQTSEGSRTLVDAIVRLGHGLGLNVVAEGVTEEQQIHILRDLQCDSIQGFLVAKPLCVEEATKFLLSKS